MGPRYRTNSYIFTTVVLYNILYEVILHIWRHSIYPKLRPEVKRIAPQLWAIADCQHCKKYNSLSDTQSEFDIFWHV